MSQSQHAFDEAVDGLVLVSDSQECVLVGQVFVCKEGMPIKNRKRSMK